MDDNVKQFFGIDVEALTAENITDESTFKAIFDVKDSFRRAKLESLLYDKAKAFKKGSEFTKLFKAAKGKRVLEAKRAVKKDNYTEFTGQSIRLFCGDWIANDNGIKGIEPDPYGGQETIDVCPHPLLMTERYLNLDTKREKVRLEFYKDGKWKNVLVDKASISSRVEIVKISAFGIQVTSENARYLIQYLYDLESLNPTEIKCYNSTDKLGWVEYSNDFIPYVDDVKFDGEQQYKVMFDNVTEAGDAAAWQQCADACRKNDTVKIMLAATFASPLIERLNKLPFFLHVWGGTGVGKTVGIMLAASVWGNPALGKLVRGMNATLVGMERLAGFMNNLPVFLNELQTVRNRERFDDTIYKMCEGQGRERGSKFGGLEKMTTWSNCFITNGEQPITSDSTGAGAINRILEIEAPLPLFEDAAAVVGIISENYGSAGKAFIKFLQGMNIDDIRKEYEAIYAELLNANVTEKQAVAGSLILVADKYACDLFNFSERLATDTMLKYLKTNLDIDQNARAFEIVRQWVASNKSRFTGKDERGSWGLYDEASDTYYIMNTYVKELLETHGYSYKVVLNYLLKNGIIRGSAGKATFTKMINGVVTRCLRFVDFTNEVMSAEEIAELDLVSQAELPQTFKEQLPNCDFVENEPKDPLY